MNKRARMRLIAVTVIILAVVTGFLIYSGTNGGAAYSKTVTEVAKDSSLVGKQVKVAGKVVNGSWNKKSNPMVFKMVAETDATGQGPVVGVVYTGTTPSTFGDGVVAIVTGKLEQGGTIKSNDMITKCPSKYTNAEGIPPLTDTAMKADAVGKPVNGTGYVVAGSIKSADQAQRFVIAGKADGSGKTIPVIWDKVLPTGFKDGAAIVLKGELNADGTFTATDVSLAQVQK